VIAHVLAMLSVRAADARRHRGTNLAVVLVVMAVTLACERDIELTLPLPTPTAGERVVHDEARDAGIVDDGAVAECAETATLESATASQDEKLAAVGRLADDPGDVATRCLIAASSNPSVLVSMASIKALTGRSCDRVAPALTLLLADEEWQRRAWSAKVIGDNRCERGSDALRARLGGEPDERVRERIEAALAVLDKEAS
jgi:hypothetical protein